ncbi:MAG: sporulation protein [Saprospiraceae bacterium]|nr:sporulation protein [Saprospiraceae bacterium]
MLKRVKKWLGIEGVKLELLLPEEISSKEGQVAGTIRLQSLEAQEVQAIKIVLIERYARGRRKDKLVDEYTLGESNIQKTIQVPANGTVEISFTLSFSRTNSKMDDWGSKNILNSGLAQALKWAEGVKSDYRIEAEALVKGVALNPFDKQPVQIR